jgi:hypothetical protein
MNQQQKRKLPNNAPIDFIPKKLGTVNKGFADSKK